LGIVVLIIAGGFGGKYLYDQKKEKDRQALIHMGDDLKKAFSDYDESIKEINKNGDLATEYTKLMESIINETVSSDELESTKKKACEMEKDLMKIYPTVYTEPSSVCK